MFAKYLRIPQNHIFMLLIDVLARFHFTQQIFWVLRSVRNLNFVIDRRLQDSDKSSWQIFELLWLLIKTISAVISNGEFLTIAVTMRHRIKNMVCYRWSCPTKKCHNCQAKIYNCQANFYNCQAQFYYCPAKCYNSPFFLIFRQKRVGRILFIKDSRIFYCSEIFTIFFPVW